MRVIFFFFKCVHQQIYREIENCGTTSFRKGYQRIQLFYLGSRDIEQLTSLVSFSKRGSRPLKKENFIRETCKNILAF